MRTIGPRKIDKTCRLMMRRGNPQHLRPQLLGDSIQPVEDRAAGTIEVHGYILGEDTGDEAQLVLIDSKGIEIDGLLNLDYACR